MNRVVISDFVTDNEAVSNKKGEKGVVLIFGEYWESPIAE